MAPDTGAFFLSLSHGCAAPLLKECFPKPLNNSLSVKYIVGFNIFRH